MANNTAYFPPFPSDVSKFPSATSFPVTNINGALVLALDTDTLYVFNTSSMTYIPIATPGAAIALDGLTGDVTATGPGVAPATVRFVGGSTAANVNSAALAFLSATSSNTPSTLVLRDSSGNFAAGNGTFNEVIIGSAGDLSTGSFGGIAFFNPAGSQEVVEIATGIGLIMMEAANASILWDVNAGGTVGSIGPGFRPDSVNAANFVRSPFYIFETPNSGATGFVQIAPANPTTPYGLALPNANGVGSLNNDGSGNLNWYQAVRTTGTDNVFVDSRSGNNTLTGVQNSGIGSGAVISLTSGNANAALGYFALHANQSGNGQTAVGAQALQNNTTGTRNTAIGDQSSLANNGSFNATLGYKSLLSAINLSQITALGYQTLTLMTAGTDTTAVGFNAGSLRASYTQTTLLGSGADTASSGLANAMALGFGASVSQSNFAQIGNTSLVGMGWTGYADMTQLATPTNPAAGHDRLYFKSDDNLYILSSGGTEKQLFAGAAANPALSNLSAVAINTSLLPASDNTTNLGSDTDRFGIGYFATRVGVGTAFPTTGVHNTLELDSGTDGVSVKLQGYIMGSNYGDLTLSASGQWTLSGDSVPLIQATPGQTTVYIGGGPQYQFAPASFSMFLSNLKISTVGTGIQVKEGSNAKQGTGTLSGGTLAVTNTSVTASSRIFITIQSLGTVTVPAPVAVTAITPGTGFTVTSASVIDTSTFAYEIFEAL